MFFSKRIVRKNKLNMAVFLFLILFFILHMTKPSLLYDQYGNFRSFGVGYKHKTVFPIWLIAVILAIFSYVTVLFYLQY